VDVRATDGWRAGGGPISADESQAVADRVELIGRPVDEIVGDWLASVGESWSQLTFFLFDPDSWR
jgi:hypothetical protein